MNTVTTVANTSVLSFDGSAELEQCFKIFSDNADNSIRTLTKEECNVLLSAICKSSLETDLKYFYAKADKSVEIESSSVFRKVLDMLKNYEFLAAMHHYQVVYHNITASQRSFADGGCVYVAEFADGCTKIGMSYEPEKRLLQISRGNQYAIVRTWISDRCLDYSKVEAQAHRHFKSKRVRSEFFRVDFDEAVNFVKGKTSPLE